MPDENYAAGEEGGFLPHNEKDEHDLYCRSKEPLGGGGFLPSVGQAEGGCDGCGAPTFNSAWFHAFGVVLCEPCRRGEQLLAKGAAKATYLLTDRRATLPTGVVAATPRSCCHDGLQLLKTMLFLRSARRASCDITHVT